MHIHRFKSVKTEIAQGVVSGFGEVPIMREQLKCKCGKIKYIGLNIATNEHLNNNLIWK